MGNGNRLQDDPVIQNINSNVNTILDKQSKIENYLLDPDNGYFKRVNDLEKWRNDTIDPERKKYKAVMAKIIWMIIGALIFGGGFLGLKLTFSDKPKIGIERLK